MPELNISDNRRDLAKRAGNAIADRLREQFGFDLDKDEEQSRKK